MRVALLAIVLLVAAAAPLPAQRIAGPAHSTVLHVPRASSATANVVAVALPIQPTHWKRGALIGGLGTGALFVILVEGGGCDCLVDALAFSPLFIIPGAFIGAMVGGLFPKADSSQQAIRVAPSDAAPTAFAHPAQARGTMNLDLRSATVRRSGNWKGAILLGVIAGAAVGLSVASQGGDEGSNRAFSDRLSDGLVAGAIVALPVTVIFAMLAGEGS